MRKKNRRFLFVLSIIVFSSVLISIAQKGSVDESKSDSLRSDIIKNCNASLPNFLPDDKPLEEISFAVVEKAYNEIKTCTKEGKRKRAESIEKKFKRLKDSVAISESSSEVPKNPDFSTQKKMTCTFDLVKKYQESNGASSKCTKTEDSGDPTSPCRLDEMIRREKCALDLFIQQKKNSDSLAAEIRQNPEVKSQSHFFNRLKAERDAMQNFRTSNSREIQNEALDAYADQMNQFHKQLELMNSQLSFMRTKAEKTKIATNTFPAIFPDATAK